VLQDVTPDNFLAALSGRDDLLKGIGTGKVIKRLVYSFCDNIVIMSMVYERPLSSLGLI